MPADGDGFDAAHRALLQTDPGAFVATRAALAKELRSSGDADAAKRVLAVRKPPVSAWVVNRLHEVAAAELIALLRAGVELRAAQSDVLGGDRDAVASLRPLGEAHRARVDALVAAAERELRRAGAAAGPAVLHRVAETLRAASTAGAPMRTRLREGTLEDDVAPQGFGGLESLEDGDDDVDADGTTAVAPEPEPEGTVTSLVAAAQRRARQAADAAARARATADADARRAVQARGRANALRQQAEQLATQLDSLRREAARAEEQAVDAERDRDRSAAAATEAERAAADAEAGVRQRTEHSRGR